VSAKLWVAGAFGAFLVSGPLQHVGALPQTAFGDASKATIKMALNLGAKEALACSFGNNGFGNGGGDGVPGRSGFGDRNR
jgi:hypothetical protein